MARIPGRPSGRTPRAIRSRGARQTGSAHDAFRADGRAGAGRWARLTQQFRAGTFPPLPSTGSEAATVASDEICRGDEDRLQRLSNSPTSDGVIRLLIELRCEKLRPQLLSLAKRLDDKAPAAPADAAQDAPASVPPGPVASSSTLAAAEASGRTSKRLRSAFLHMAFSRGGMRAGRQPRTCRRSFWLSSAGGQGTRLGSDEPEPPAAQAAEWGALS